jgi:hypothetical protein
VWFRRGPGRREDVINEQSRAPILALIRKYYPLLLAELVLGCVVRQQRGHYARCCRSTFCPCCSPRESHTRALAQYAAFQACTPHAEKVRLAHEVYTLPPMLHRLVFTPEGFAAWRRAVRDTIRELHAAPVSGVMNLHPMGDLDPTKYHAHWDVVVNGFHLDASGTVVKTPSLAFDYDQGREVYRRHLCRAFRLQGASVPEVLDVWWDRKRTAQGVQAFHSGKLKTWKMVQYSARNVYRPDRAWLLPAEVTGQPADTDWAYKPRDDKPMHIFHGPAVMQNLLAQRAWLKGKLTHTWFGYLKDRHRAAAQARIRPPLPAQPDASPSTGAPLRENDTHGPEDTPT